MASSPCDHNQIELREDFRRLHIEIEREAASGFDRAMTTLSGGALALSIAFVRDIAPHPEWKLFLMLAWAGFGFALVFNVVSYLANQEACRKLRDELDAEEDLGGNKWRSVTNWLNYLSVLLFAVGIAFLAMFTGYNL